MVKPELGLVSGAWLGPKCSADGSVVCHSLVEVWSCDLGSEFLDLPKFVRTFSLGMTRQLVRTFSLWDDWTQLTCETPILASSF